MAANVTVELEKLNISDSKTHQTYASLDSNEEHDSKDSDSNQVEVTLHPHGKPEELPGGVFHSIRFTEDTSPISKWLQERRKHVDDYTCTIYVSFTASVSRMTALHLACLYNRVDAIKILLEAGADVAVTDSWGRNALHCLCSSKSKKTIFRALNLIMPSVLKHERNHEVVNVCDNNKGRTPLLEACLMNRTRAVTFLVKSLDENVVDFAQMTPLHCVCASPEQDEDVESLFDFILEFSKTSVNARDSNGRTPFLVACKYNKPTIAKKLLEAGSDVYAQDNDDETALHYLSASKSDNVEELLTIITNRVTNFDTIEGFLSTENLDHAEVPTTDLHFINKKNAKGLTPFQVALSSKNRCINNAKILIRKGVNIHVTLDDDRWPLQYACSSKDLQLDLAITLIKSGADLSVLIDKDPLLHFACKNDFVELVDCMLKRGADVSQTNELQKKPMYYVQSNEVCKLLVKAGAIDYGYRDLDLLRESCIKGYTDRAVYLIKHMNKKSIHAKYLLLAVEFDRKSIAMAMVKHPHWYQFLRYSSVSRGSGIPTTPFRELIRKMPDVAEVVLDKCIVSNPEVKDHKNDNCSTVLMNYEFLDDFATSTISAQRVSELSESSELLMRKRRTLAEVDIPVYQGHDCSYEQLQEIDPPTEFSTKWGPVHFSKSNHPLSIMAEYGRNELLSHPVASTLFLHKWEHFGLAYYINLLVFVLFLFLLNLYTFLLDSPISDRCIVIRANNTNTSIQCDTNEAKQIFLYIAAALILVMALVRLTFDVRTLFRFRNVVIFKHGVRLCLYSTSILFALIFHAECQCIAFWQWQCGVAAVFLCWISMVVYLSKFPYIGIYVIMLIRVFYTFLKVLILFLFLVVTFGLAFFMAFHEPSILRSPFSTPARTLLKMVTMTTGEFEFDAIFRQAPNGDSDEESEIPFEEISYILWIIFIVVMPVLLTNMLVGLAVGDIGNIQHSALVEKRKLQVNQIIAMEETLRSWPFRKKFTIAWKKIYPNNPISNMRWWLKYRNILVGIIWYEEEQDSILKSITNILSRREKHPDKYNLETSELQKSQQQKQQQEGAEDTTKLQVDISGLKEEIVDQRELIVEMKREFKHQRELAVEMKREFKVMMGLLAQNAGKTASLPETSAI